MSQQSYEVQRLEALLRQKAEEARMIENQLHRARSSARSSVSTAPLDFDAVPGDYQVSLSRPSLNDHGRSRSNTVPRSAVAVSMVAADLGLKAKPEHGQQLQDQTRPMKRSKTTHQAVPPPSTGKMTRSSSNASPRMTMTPVKHNPFVAKGLGLVTPPLPPAPARNSYSGPGMLQDYLNQNPFQQPANAYIHGDSLYPEQPLRRPMEPLSTDGVEMNVDEFLSMREVDDSFSTTSPLQIPSGDLLSPDAAQFGIPSACGSMTSGPTIETAPMTRSNSTMNDNASISGHFNEMVRIHSQQSTRGGHARQDSFGHTQPVNHPSLLGKRAAMVDHDFLAMGANLPDYSHAYGSSAPVDSGLSEHHHAMEKSVSQSSTRSSSSSVGLADNEYGFLAQHLSMERSVSKDSTKSNQSLKFRAKEALARQNINAKSRNLQPKPAADQVKKVPVESAPSSNKGKDGKAVIQKAKYERPKHPKVKCTQCNENPEGFRGEHELRRHTEAKHKSTVKKWICRDPSEVGIHHTETPMKALRDCKQCSQAKQYGAYYNAAAHLRRTHFKMKPARKGAGSKGGSKGSSSNKADDEKRGGKGGGDWPSMAELKLWMVEVSVPMDQEGAFLPDGAESIGAVDADDLENELLDAQYGPQAAALRVGSGVAAYDMAAFAGVGGGFNNDLDGVDPSYQSLQGDLGPQGAADLYIDPSMYVSSSMRNMQPISSSGFDFHQSSSHQTQHHMPSSSMMSLDSHNYTSPVSSTATITQAGVFGEPHIPSHLARSDLNLDDMSFDLTFATESLIDGRVRVST
ncbi:hypothetical protein B0H66DRAFT_628891 [Apodospora peruviana]|uniref:DUF7896 domain-containing protein n=1 Tax=Apodospora peruviana TaxID=516989 RepID=A0AAE0HZF9_9PEZI|nr:hypothetical protein B0H66DRAFT_628891 [Apodospora peruviana]